MIIDTFIKKFRCNRNVTESPVNSFKMDFHLHDEYEIFMLLSGGVRYFIEKNSYNLVPGDVLIMKSGEIHKASFISNEPYERIVFHFSPDLLKIFSYEDHALDYCYTNRRRGEKNRLNSTDEEKTALIAMFEKMVLLRTYNQTWNPQLSLALFLEIMVKINRIYSDDTRNFLSPLQHRKLKPILDYIDSNLEDDLSIGALQKRFFITGSYLCQIFKQTTGSTLHEYIIYKRISRAKQLLMRGESAAHASYKSGFSDYSNFVRAFRKVTGFSPREYLKQYML